VENFSLLKFLSGFNIFNGAKLAKIIFYGILLALGIGIYHKLFIQPTYKTNQTTTITQPENVYISPAPKTNDVMFVGVKVWRIRFGLSLG